MKKLIALAVFCTIGAILLQGCSTTYVKTPEWEAKVTSHWLKRDVDKLAVNRLADGSYSVDLNGYKSDASEQLPAFTKEMWAGIGILGRLAGAAINPAVATVPLTAEAANADDVAQLVKANAALKTQVAEAKAALAKVKAAGNAASTTGGTTTDCADGNCGIKQ